MREMFTTFATKTAQAVGSYLSFLFAFLIVILWGATGQLVINTGTTIITFLMVFLIQNTQNRDAKAMHLKLDELIDATKAARNEMIDIEDLSDDKLQEIAEFFKKKKEQCEQEETREVAKGEAEKVATDTAKKVVKDTVKDDAKRVA
jgi:low affinity Fe/Cu permease